MGGFLWILQPERLLKKHLGELPSPSCVGNVNVGKYKSNICRRWKKGEKEAFIGQVVVKLVVEEDFVGSFFRMKRKRRGPPPAYRLPI